MCVCQRDQGQFGELHISFAIIIINKLTSKLCPHRPANKVTYYWNDICPCPLWAVTSEKYVSFPDPGKIRLINAGIRHGRTNKREAYNNQ